MSKRNIIIDEVEEALVSTLLVEDYPNDFPFPSQLLLGHTVNNRPLHMVLAINPFNGTPIVITAYEPDDQEWEADLVTRKIKGNTP
jgi:Domain of unknown function (DUF4258)